MSRGKQEREYLELIREELEPFDGRIVEVRTSHSSHKHIVAEVAGKSCRFTFTTSREDPRARCNMRSFVRRTARRLADG